MGDILHALPAVTALRKAHPGWMIDWVVEPTWRPCCRPRRTQAEHPWSRLSAQPVVDRLHFASTKEWRERPFAGETRAEIASLTPIP